VNRAAVRYENRERDKGFEPSTSTLARETALYMRKVFRQVSSENARARNGLERAAPACSV
jgi:hypothetical protein